MSRLFSRLENRGQDEAGLAPPAGPAPVPDALPGAAADVPAEAGSGNAAPAPAAANSPVMPPLVPGYAISTSLSLPALPPPVPETRPAWPVSLWLASLLLLIGLSLLVLAMPERLLPAAGQPQETPQAAPAVPAEPSAGPPSAAAAGSPAAPPKSAIVTAVPALPPASAPRAEPRSSAATPTPAPSTPAAPAPLPSGGSAACSEAMLAMNLCSKSSP